MRLEERQVKVDITADKRELLQLQRRARAALRVVGRAKKCFSEMKRRVKIAKANVESLKNSGGSTVRASHTLAVSRLRCRDALKSLSVAKREHAAARRLRKLQEEKLGKTYAKKQQCKNRQKVESLRARQEKQRQALEARERKRQRQLEKRHEEELACLKASHAAAEQRLRERQSNATLALKNASTDRVRKLRAKHHEGTKSYRDWIASEEWRHADKFKRCVGGSLGNALCILRPKTQAHQYTLVYLHQFSCWGFGYAYDKPHYFYSSTKFRFNGLKVVFPTAPERPITAQDGWERRAWYDYLTDFDGVREDKVNMKSLRETRDRIFQLLDHEIGLLGGDASRVFIGGASQGCCTALHCALQYPRVLGGFVGIVGHLLSCSPVPQAKRHMPISLYNGRDDDIMRWSWVRKTFRRLENAGYSNLKMHCEPETGHAPGPKERAWLVDFLGQRVPNAER
jgi:phospholipase/carboxylesterase